MHHSIKARYARVSRQESAPAASEPDLGALWPAPLASDPAAPSSPRADYLPAIPQITQQLDALMRHVAALRAASSPPPPPLPTASRDRRASSGGRRTTASLSPLVSPRALLYLAAGPVRMSPPSSGGAGEGLGVHRRLSSSPRRSSVAGVASRVS